MSKATSVCLIGVVLVGACARLELSPRFDGIDDLGYIQAATRVAAGMGSENAPWFYQRIGMTYPLAWLLRCGAEPGSFWLLTNFAELVTALALFAVVSSWLGRSAGLVAAALYSVYPMALGQACYYMPTAFQIAAITVGAWLFTRSAAAESALAVALAYSAGLSIGVGYLVKEDVAIAVPAMAMAAVATKFCRLSVVTAFCFGAATVFWTECTANYLVHGSWLYRLARTSGQAAPVSDALGLASIWHWSAYLRTLWVMPYQVGLYWWFFVPAAIAIVRRGDRTSRFLFGSLIILALYLQFGTNSLSAYVPLPKTARYTAITTPFLISLLAWWVVDLQKKGHVRFASYSLVLLVVTALPCIGFEAISGGERTRNSVAAVAAIKKERAATVYTDFYSARTLTALTRTKCDIELLLHANLSSGQEAMHLRATPNDLLGNYVLIDHQACKVYTSSYQLKLPGMIAKPPAKWRPVWSHHAFPRDGLAFAALNSIRGMNSSLPTNFLTARVERNLADMLDDDTATLYFVPND